MYYILHLLENKIKSRGVSNWDREVTYPWMSIFTISRHKLSQYWAFMSMSSTPLTQPVMPLMRSVKRFQVIFVNSFGYQEFSDGNERYDDKGKQHLQISNTREGEATQHTQLQKLQRSEGVDSFLGNLSDVMYGRVEGLLSHHQQHSLPQLKVRKGGDGDE